MPLRGATRPPADASATIPPCRDTSYDTTPAKAFHQLRRHRHGADAAGADRAIAGSAGGLEKWLYDRREKDCQYFRKPPTNQIVHIDIDDASLESIGKWPWPRDEVARILREFDRAGPKVIGIDIVYIDPAPPRIERLPDGAFHRIDEDAVLAQR